MSGDLLTCAAATAGASAAGGKGCLPRAVPLGTPIRSQCSAPLRQAAGGDRAPRHPRAVLLGTPMWYRFSAPPRRAAGGDRAPGHPDSIPMQYASAAGGRGRPRPLHPRPRAPPLGTPIRCDCRWEGQARMPMGRGEQAAHDPGFGIPEACATTLILPLPSHAGGLGARCAPSGEREGQSPLAAMGTAWVCQLDAITHRAPEAHAYGARRAGSS